MEVILEDMSSGVRILVTNHDGSIVCKGLSSFAIVFFVRLMICKGEIKEKAIPIQACYRPMGFQEVETPRFHDNLHINVIRLSALCTGPPFPQEIFLVQAERRIHG
jgi:hypothetical protein